MTISLKLRAWIREARSLTVLTGAGISAESGIPTFRGKEGLWKTLRPEELANVEAFLKNPELVWEWYRFRREIVAKAVPNPGHAALAQLEACASDFTLVTQNVDGLHRRAGSRHVIELHGNILDDVCLHCGKKSTEASGGAGPVPRCACGGPLRPGVVWFGEALPAGAFEKAAEASARAELFLSVGTSAVVYPAASLPLVAREAGAYVVEINPERTELSSAVDETLIGKAGEILPALLAERRAAIPTA